MVSLTSPSRTTLNESERTADAFTSGLDSYEIGWKLLVQAPFINANNKIKTEQIDFIANSNAKDWITALTADFLGQADVKGAKIVKS